MPSATSVGSCWTGPSQPSMIALAERTLSWERAAMTPAVSRTDAANVSAATTVSTRPIRSAVRAEISSPVKSSSFARAGPTSAARRRVVERGYTMPLRWAIPPKRLLLAA